jgi:hypothetical protein
MKKISKIELADKLKIVYHEVSLGIESPAIDMNEIMRTDVTEESAEIDKEVWDRL